jgi:hypothetical protein
MTPIVLGLVLFAVILSAILWLRAARPFLTYMAACARRWVSKD